MTSGEDTKGVNAPYEANRVFSSLGGVKNILIGIDSKSTSPISSGVV